MSDPNPILVEVTRGSEMESVHRGAVAVVDHQGRTLQAWGALDTPVYPRSAVKPLQALPLLAAGAARALDITPEEIALACASHGGEPVHTRAVAAWLERLGHDPGVLACGAHPPTDNTTRAALARAGEAASALHNNCSGKHAGFLSVCRHLGFPAAGYTHAHHPVQGRVREALARLTDCPLDDAPRGVDGCGIPVFAIPLRGLALGMARLANPAGLDDGTAAALDAIREAMVAHPRLVAGRGRFCTQVIAALAPGVVVKSGAEGVYCAAVRDPGLGIALKIDDGATRAAEVAVGAVLRRLRLFGDAQLKALRPQLEPDVLNVAGAPVGRIRAAAAITRG